jgi:hypothetical protein
MLSAQDRERLQTSRNLWLATVRPNGSPHLVPIWFVWLNDKVYLCTSRNSVKGRNIAANGRIAFALEDGDDPLVIEGNALLLDSAPPELVEAFQKKFDWNITGDSTYNAVVEITPSRVVR